MEHFKEEREEYKQKLDKTLKDLLKRNCSIIVDKDFIEKWMDRNINYFDSFKDVEVLLMLTAHYINNIIQNKVNHILVNVETKEHFSKTEKRLKQKANEMITLLKDQIKANEDEIKIEIKMEKADELIRHLEEVIRKPQNYVYRKDKYEENVKNIRDNLRKRAMENKEINIYIEYFRDKYKKNENLIIGTPFKNTN